MRRLKFTLTERAVENFLLLRSAPSLAGRYPEVQAAVCQAVGMSVNAHYLPEREPIVWAFLEGMAELERLCEWTKMQAEDIDYAWSQICTAEEPNEPA